MHASGHSCCQVTAICPVADGGLAGARRTTAAEGPTARAAPRAGHSGRRRAIARAPATQLIDQLPRGSLEPELADVSDSRDVAPDQLREARRHTLGDFGRDYDADRMSDVYSAPRP